MSLVLLPDGEIKQSKQILKDIVICSDNSQYYWNEFSEDIIKASYSVNSVPPFIIPESDCGIINKISYVLSGVNYNSSDFGLIYPTGGSGTGFCVKVDTTEISKYVLNSYTIDNAGTNYKIGDVVFCDILGTLVVTSTNSIQKNQIKNYDVTFDTSFRNTPIQKNILASSSTGTPSSFVVSFDETNMYEIESIQIINAGTGYESGDVININGIGSFSLDVDYGNKNITSFEIQSLSSTHYYQLSQLINNLPSYTKGNGSGATFKASYTKQWNVNKCNMISGGSGYKIGDYLYISSNMTNYAYATVTEVAVGSNKILSFHSEDSVINVDNEVTNYLIHASGGTGYGATFYVNSSPSDAYTLNTISVNSEGNGFSVGDTITIPNRPNLSISVESVYDVGAITSYTPSISVTQSSIKPASIISTTTNSVAGSGYTCSLTYTVQDYYILSGSQIINGGSGFVAGNTYNFAQGNIVVNSIYSGGEILNYTKNISTNWFYGSSGTQTLSVNSKTGTGAVATITVSTNKSDVVYYPTFSISAAGTGYKVGDLFLVIDENNINLGTIVVTEVGVNGNISSIKYTAEKVSQSIHLTYSYTSNSGSNATFTPSFVTTKNYFKIVDISITSMGLNYEVGDILQVGIYGSLTVTEVASNGALKEYTLTSTVPDNNTSNVSTVTISNATLSLSWTKTFKYLITGIIDVTHGSGYAVGDVVTIGNYASFVVNSVTGAGQIKTISYTDSEKYYLEDNSESNVAGTSTTGTGATFDISYSNVKINAITSIKMNDSGYSYTSGDILKIGEYGTIIVDTVETGSQEILSCDITLVPDYFNWDFSGTMNGYGGEGVTGTGATFNVTSIQSYIYNNLSLVNSGMNYNVGDILDIDGDTYSDNNYYSDGGIIKVTGVQKNSQPVKNIENIKSDIIQNKIDGNINVTGGSGTGLVVSITYKEVVAYKINDITLLASGNNYNVGDTLDLNGYGTATVTEIHNTGGNVLELSQNIKTIDSDKVIDESGTYNLTGGSGTNLSLNIKYEPVSYYEISNIKIINGGYGYTINDYLMLDNFQGISVTSIKNNIS